MKKQKVYGHPKTLQTPSHATTVRGPRWRSTCTGTRRKKEPCTVTCDCTYGHTATCPLRAKSPCAPHTHFFSRACFLFIHYPNLFFLKIQTGWRQHASWWQNQSGRVQWYRVESKPDRNGSYWPIIVGFELTLSDQYSWAGSGGQSSSLVRLDLVHGPGRSD